MMVFRALLLSALLVAALGLSGCLESKKPLFDEAKAVTPAAAGRYLEQERTDKGWVDHLTGTLELEGKAYSWKPDDREGVEFYTLHDIGGGFYIAAARAKTPKPEDPYVYALFQKAPEGFLSYTPVCNDLTRMRVPPEYMPEVLGSQCFFKDRDQLVGALEFYARYMLPTNRYVPLKP